MLRRSFALNLLGAINTYLLGFVSSILLARFLGPSDRGLLGVELAVVNFAYAFTGLGLPYSVEYHAGRRERSGALLGNMLVYGLGLAIVLVPTCWVLQGWLASLFGKGHGGTTWLIVGGLIPLTFLQWTSVNQLSGSLRFGWFNAIFAANRALYLLFVVVLVLATPARVSAGLLATGLAAAVAAAAGYAILLREDRLAFDVPLLRRMLGYGSRLWWGSLFQILNFRLDVIILQFFRPLSDVGYYVVAQAVAELVNGLAIAFHQSVLPLVSSHDDETGRQRTTTSALRHQLILSAAAAIAIAAIGPAVVLLGFGHAYRAALQPMLILLPGILLLNLGTVVRASLAGRGRPGISSTLAGISLVVTVALDLTLIPRFGVTGAALASVVAYSTYGILSIIVLGRLMQTSPWELAIPTRADFLLYPAAARALWRRVVPAPRTL